MVFSAALPTILSLTLSVWAGETSEWLLAGQEGKCIPLSTLTKKGPEFQDIKSPYQLVEKMRAAGHRAEIKEHKAGSRPAVEVRVPSRGSLRYVRQELGVRCQRTGEEVTAVLPALIFFFLPPSGTIGLFEDFFSQANRLRRHFHQLVVGDPFDPFFQSHLPVR